MNGTRFLRSTEVIIGLAVLACFILLGWLDYASHRSSAARFDTFSSYDFQQGGYHAWYDLLRREGLRVERFQRQPAYLDASISTLIVANNAVDAMIRQDAGENVGQYGAEDVRRVARWVQSGGRLVWLVDQATGAAQGGPTARIAGAPAKSALRLPLVVRSGHDGDAAVPIIESPLTAGVTSLAGSSELRIPFDASPHVTPLIADPKGSVVAWYQLGRGSVVVVTDETLFDNGHIGKADNARLAFNLAAFGVQPADTVAFEEWSHGYQSGDTWWTIMPRTLQVAVAIVAGALLLLLAGAAWRFGPAARLPDDVERTSEEYLTSMAALLERGHAARRAVRDLAQIALQAAAKSVGMPDSAPASSIAERLRRSDAGDQRAQDLITLERLAGYEHPSALELVRAARLSRTLRKDLSFDGPHALRPRRSPQRRSA